MGFPWCLYRHRYKTRISPTSARKTPTGCRTSRGSELVGLHSFHFATPFASSWTSSRAFCTKASSFFGSS